MGAHTSIITIVIYGAVNSFGEVPVQYTGISDDKMIQNLIIYLSAVNPGPNPCTCRDRSL